MLARRHQLDTSSSTSREIDRRARGSLAAGTPLTLDPVWTLGQTRSAS
jgi:hypothetical protein